MKQSQRIVKNAVFRYRRSCHRWPRLPGDHPDHRSCGQRHRIRQIFLCSGFCHVRQQCRRFWLAPHADPGNRQRSRATRAASRRRSLAHLGYIGSYVSPGCAGRSVSTFGNRCENIRPGHEYRHYGNLPCRRIQCRAARIRR